MRLFDAIKNYDLNMIIKFIDINMPGDETNSDPCFTSAERGFEYLFWDDNDVLLGGYTVWVNHVKDRRDMIEGKISFFGNGDTGEIEPGKYIEEFKIYLNTEIEDIRLFILDHVYSYMEGMGIKKNER